MPWNMRDLLAKWLDTHPALRETELTMTACQSFSDEQNFLHGHVTAVVALHEPLRPRYTAAARQCFTALLDSGLRHHSRLVDESQCGHTKSRCSPRSIARIALTCGSTGVPSPPRSQLHESQLPKALIFRQVRDDALHVRSTCES